MPNTSSTTEDAKPLKTDRRADLDGGLDTRSSVITSTPDKALSLGNFRFTKEGALTKRRGGQELCRLLPYSTPSTQLPAPVITAIATGGAGLALGTYPIQYALGSVSDSSASIGAWAGRSTPAVSPSPSVRWCGRASTSPPISTRRGTPIW